MMTDSQHLKIALEAGAVDYIRKPVDFVELTARIKSMLALSHSYQVIQKQNTELETQKQELAQEKETSDNLLLNILPKEISQELKSKNKVDPQYRTDVTILFSDFVGFTQIAEQTSPQQLVERLDQYFGRFDEIVDRFNLEKIKTIGDAYMCAGGVPTPSAESAQRVVMAGLEILQSVDEINNHWQTRDQPAWEIRIGVHTGDVIAGVVGKKKFTYDIWGDTVNIAARMESSGSVGRVNISESTYHIVKDQFHCIERGKIPAKNKGDITMYFIEGVKPLSNDAID